MALALFRTAKQRMIGPTAEAVEAESETRELPQGYEGVPLDAVLEEQITDRYRVTRFPVERDADIMDHAIPEPSRYLLRGVVSDLPVYYRSTQYNHADASTRSTSALALIRDLAATREPFAILDGLALLDSVVIEQLDASRSGTESNLVEIEASLLQVRIVSAEAAEDQPEQLGELEAGQAQEQASPALDRGQEGAGPISRAWTKVTESEAVKALRDVVDL